MKFDIHMIQREEKAYLKSHERKGLCVDGKEREGLETVEVVEDEGRFCKNERWKHSFDFVKVKYGNKG